MILTYKDGKKDKIHIYIDQEYSLTVDRDFFLSQGIKNGYEISCDELNELTSKINARRAFNKAVDLLSRRDHSKKELSDKLKQKGFGSDFDEVFEKLESYGYLDDERFARNYTKQLIEFKSFGKMRIKQELFKKGIDRDLISEILEEIQIDENDLVDLIERKYKRNLYDEKGVKRTFNTLVRLGYSYSEIKSALSQIQLQED